MPWASMELREAEVSSLRVQQRSNTSLPRPHERAEPRLHPRAGGVEDT